MPLLSDRTYLRCPVAVSLPCYCNQSRRWPYRTNTIIVRARAERKVSDTGTWVAEYSVLAFSTANERSVCVRYNLATLRQFFETKFGKNTPAFKAAQRSFTESMAGYSLVCYFLQIKARPRYATCSQSKFFFAVFTIVLFTLYAGSAQWQHFV